MYFPFFIMYILIGFGISGAVFFWALKTGQFTDQKRAAFLPLLHDTKCLPARPAGRIHRIEAIMLIAMACLGLLVSASVLVHSLMRAM